MRASAVDDRRSFSVPQTRLSRCCKCVSRCLTRWELDKERLSVAVVVVAAATAGIAVRDEASAWQRHSCTRTTHTSGTEERCELGLDLWGRRHVGDGVGQRQLEDVDEGARERQYKDAGRRVGT